MVEPRQSARPLIVTVTGTGSCSGTIVTRHCQPKESFVLRFIVASILFYQWVALNCNYLMKPRAESFAVAVEHDRDCIPNQR